MGHRGSRDAFEKSLTRPTFFHKSKQFFERPDAHVVDHRLELLHIVYTDYYQLKESPIQSTSRPLTKSIMHLPFRAFIKLVASLIGSKEINLRLHHVSFIFVFIHCFNRELAQQPPACSHLMTCVLVKNLEPVVRCHLQDSSKLLTALQPSRNHRPCIATRYPRTCASEHGLHSPVLKFDCTLRNGPKI